MHDEAGNHIVIHVLGPVAITTRDRHHDRLTAQLRKVAALLAVNRGIFLSAEQIVRRIWDGTPPDSAAQMVRNQIRSLRMLLGGPMAVEHSRHGYRLAVPAVEIDGETFAARVHEGRRLLVADRVTDAARTLEQGIRLWHGPDALADVRDVPDLDIQALGLQELRYQAEELIVEAYLASGRPADALPILWAMTAQHPARERPWLQLMAAQTLIGRRIEASVETFRLAQHHLVETTGLDAPLLGVVHQALLRGMHGHELISLIRRGSRQPG